MFTLFFTDNIESSRKSGVVLPTLSVSNDSVKVATAYGLIVQDVHDGNCTLHAVIDQLSVLMHPMTETITELRNKAVTFLRRNSIKLQVEQYLDINEFKNVDAYLRHQSRDGVWLDESMMRALTEVLQRISEFIRQMVMLHYWPLSSTALMVVRHRCVAIFSMCL